MVALVRGVSRLAVFDLGGIQFQEFSILPAKEDSESFVITVEKILMRICDSVYTSNGYMHVKKFGENYTSITCASKIFSHASPRVMPMSSHYWYLVVIAMHPMVLHFLGDCKTGLKLSVKYRHSQTL